MTVYLYQPDTEPIEIPNAKGGIVEDGVLHVHGTAGVIAVFAAGAWSHAVAR